MPHSFGPTHFAACLAPCLRKRRNTTRISTSTPPAAIASSLSTPRVSIAGFWLLSGHQPDREAPIYGRPVASPDDIKAHASPETVEQLVDHRDLMHGTEAWPFMDGGKMRRHLILASAPSGFCEIPLICVD